MALTYRTGSGGKGSALTIEELDNNFRHFTGSHDVSGSFTVSGSTTIIGDAVVTGSLTVSGSNTFTNEGAFSQVGFDTSFDVTAGTNTAGLRKIDITGSIATTGSGAFYIFNQGGGGISSIDFRINGLPTSDPNVSGRLWRDGTDLKISVG
jgi:hypothetical protein